MLKPHRQSDHAFRNADPIALLGYLFGPANDGLPEPFERVGQDPTSDTLVCAP